MKGSNSDLLDDFFRRGLIRLSRGPLFDLDPPPLPETVWDRVEGMLLGLAIGDALGHGSESLVPAVRRERFAEIRMYLDRPGFGGAVGLPSDNTQLAFWTLEHLLECGGLEPSRLAHSFAHSGHIYGLGSTVREFLRRFKEEHLPWEQCGPDSAGNGALMRIAPVLIPYVARPSRRLWADVALAAMLTHNDATSTSACLTFVHLLWQALAMDRPPSPDWWWRTYVDIARPLEGDVQLQSRVPRDTFVGPLWRFVEEGMPEALEEGWSTLEAGEHWYSGAFLLETVPNVLFILARYAQDPQEAVVRAVNDTRDNDTIAAIVGAAVGALHGKAAWPRDWLEGLSGRTREDDDGRVFALIREAKERFGPA